MVGGEGSAVLRRFHNSIQSVAAQHRRDLSSHGFFIQLGDEIECRLVQ
jgi:hypothetical protein